MQSGTLRKLRLLDIVVIDIFLTLDDIEHVVFSVLFLNLIDSTILLVDAGSEVDGILAEGHIQILQEAVESLRQTRGGTGCGFDTRLSLVNNHPIGHGGCHDEIVLYQKDSSAQMVDDPSLHDLGGDDTLLTIQGGTGLV